MNAQDWLGLTLTSLSIVALVAGAVKWYINTQQKPMSDRVQELCEAIDDIRKETKTNGGSSMRDEIKSIKKQQEEDKEVREQMNQKLNHLYDLFVDYVSRH